MEIVIGRNSQTRQLCVIKDGTTRNYGQPNSVPMDVSRHHLSLQPVGTGKWKIKNLSETNVTFVNGVAVEEKTVSEGDKIELGNSHYLFQWAAIQEPKVETVDIRPLRQVWDEYNEANKRIRLHQKNIGLLSSIPIGVSMFGGLLSGLGPDEIKPYAYVFTCIALLIMCYGFYKRLTDDSINEAEDIKKKFQRNYVCPKCGHFMNYQDYEILIQNDACPYCRTKYRK